MGDICIILVASCLLSFSFLCLESAGDLFNFNSIKWCRVKLLYFFFMFRWIGFKTLI